MQIVNLILIIYKGDGGVEDGDITSMSGGGGGAVAAGTSGDLSGGAGHAVAIAMDHFTQTMGKQPSTLSPYVIYLSLRRGAPPPGYSWFKRLCFLGLHATGHGDACVRHRFLL